jgi:flagellar export protein FliJ
MTDRHQLSKLQKIIDFYEQECDVLKRRLLKQKAIVVEKQHHLASLQEQLVRTQQRFDGSRDSAFNHQLVCHLMNSISTNINCSEQELARAVTELQQRRTELQQKMSRIESLEKLSAIKSEEIAQHDRKREQHLADDRYLNTHFTGMIK